MESIDPPPSVDEEKEETETPKNVPSVVMSMSSVVLSTKRSSPQQLQLPQQNTFMFSHFVNHAQPTVQKLLTSHMKFHLCEGLTKEEYFSFENKRWLDHCIQECLNMVHMGSTDRDILFFLQRMYRRQVRNKAHQKRNVHEMNKKRAQTRASSVLSSYMDSLQEYYSELETRLLANQFTVLDVGCGDGEIVREIAHCVHTNRITLFSRCIEKKPPVSNTLVATNNKHQVSYSFAQKKYGNNERILSHPKLNRSQIIGVDILDIAPTLCTDFLYVKRKEDNSMFVATSQKPEKMIETGSVDLVTALMCLHHVKDIYATLREVKRVLHPVHGRFIVREHDIDTKIQRDERLYLDLLHGLFSISWTSVGCTEENVRFPQDYYANYLTFSSLREMLENEGFVLLSDGNVCGEPPQYAYCAVLGVASSGDVL